MISPRWLGAIAGYFFLHGWRGILIGYLIGWMIETFYRTQFRPFTRNKGTEQAYNRQEHTRSGYAPEEKEGNLSRAYHILGVSPTDPEDILRQTYRSAALRWHPDRFSGKSVYERKEAEKIFARITWAKDVIWKARGMK